MTEALEILERIREEARIYLDEDDSQVIAVPVSVIEDAIENLGAKHGKS